MVLHSMRRKGHRIAAALAAGALALPGAAWGQSAGDDQYEDPFAPEPGQTEDGGSGSGSGSGSGTADDDSSGGGAVQPAPTPEAAPAAPAAAATTTAQAEQLPRTGADAGLLALAGTLLLAGGVAIRVRLSEPARPRR